MQCSRLIPVLLAASVPLVAASDQIKAESGSLEGVAGAIPGVRVYKGIPFAAPPVGDLRWRAPRPPHSWDGVRKAAEFSPVCEQTPYPVNSIYRSAPQPTSEDCLYLNVWTAAKSPKERRPVMVWIHGGALTRGSGSTPVYDGEALANKGVVLVTINYRLGVFGFLAHPELTRESGHNASGNYGFLDQIAALQWVQKNIAAFGGDPKRVTIFGESAGSWSVNYLVATPLAKGLFARAIGESGGAFAPMKKLAGQEQAGAKLGPIQALRAKSAQDLLKTNGSFEPNVDGWLLPDEVHKIFADGRQNDVPLIAGSNADEATSLVPWSASGTAAAFVERTRSRFGDQTDAFLKIYPASSDEEAKAAHYASFRDLVFGWQMRTWARMTRQTGKSKAYLYYFSRVPPGPDSARYGAYHAAEIPYVFGNLDSARRPWEDADRKLSELMMAYWVNFATSGDPNGAGLPKWPPYEEKSDLAIELGDQPGPLPALHKPALDFLDSYYESLRKR